MCAASPALAQQSPGAGAADRRRRASEHVQKGDAFKESGDYRAAAREYQTAYALVPHPVLFFNLAQVFRLDGDKARAVDYYERYVAADPNGRAADQARAFADRLRRELDLEEGAAADRSRPDATARPKKRTGAPRSPPHAGRGLRIAGMIAAGAGLVAVGLGVKFGIDAGQASDDINSHSGGAWTEELLARQADGERAERNMLILTAAGAAAIAAGGALYWFGHRAGRDAAERAVALGPMAADGGMGLALSGRF